MELRQFLDKTVADPQMHARWLNTLSFMENAGARKISACEDKEQVNLIILKHAAEEHRHAYYLKKQIGKIDASLCPTYTQSELLAPNHTRHYLNELDVTACRYLKQKYTLQGGALKYAAYLFVTYAIEVRADALYPHYQEALDAVKSKVNVKSIILEEEGHLEEMINQLKSFASDWESSAADIVALEEVLFQRWITALQSAIN